MNRISVLLLCCAALLLPAVATAQQYVVSTSPITYQPLPIAGGGPQIFPSGLSWLDDDQFSNYPLPFPFQFFGTTYSAINIGTNTKVTFGSDSASGSNYGFPGSSTPNNLIAVWSDDNNQPTGSAAPNTSISVQTLGSAPNRTFVIQWHSVRYGTTWNFQTQLWLTEGSSVIQVKYGSTTGSATNVNAAMGIENSTGTTSLLGPGLNGVACSPNCTASQFPTNTMIQYGVTVEPDATATVSVGTIVQNGGNLEFPVALNVRNLGLNPATPLNWNIYQSSDGVLDTAVDTLVAQHTTDESVAGQGVASFSDAVSIPRPGPGTYWMCVQLDPANRIVESNEGNNWACVQNPFLVGADLIGTVTGPASTTVDEYARFSVQLRNRGTDASGTFRYTIALSENDTVGADQPIYNGTASVLGGETVNILLDVLMPANLIGNQFYPVLIVDSAAQVTEANENNNSYISTSPIAMLLANLAVNNPSLTGDGCFFGRPMTVSFRVCNNGQWPATNFVNSIFLSDGNAINIGEDPEVSAMPTTCTGLDSQCGDIGGGQGVCFRGTCHYPCETNAECGAEMVCANDREIAGRKSCQNALAVGQCKTITRTFDMPFTDSWGNSLQQTDDNGMLLEQSRYFLMAVTDPTDKVNEGALINRQNNYRPSLDPIFCRLPAPDFTAVTVVPPARVAAGETASVYRVIGNIGNVDSEVSYRYFLSTNESLSENDIVLPVQATGQDGTATVVAGRENRITELVTIPSNVAPGSYFLGLVVNTGSLRELSGENNQFVITAPIVVERSALRVVTASLPAATIGASYARQLVAAGGTGTYTWSAENLPPGMTLTSDGLFSGMPADDGTFVFTVRVTSGDASANAMLAFVVNKPMGALTVTTSSLPPAIVGQNYQARITASGGSGDYACEFTNLPGYLTAGGCVLNGSFTSAQPDPYQFSVKVIDNVTHAEANADLTLAVLEQADLRIIDRRFVEQGSAGTPFYGCIQAGPRGRTYNWTVDLGDLAADIDGDGQPDLQATPDGDQVCVSGIPYQCQALPYMVHVEVSDQAGQQHDAADVALTITCKGLELVDDRIDPVKAGDTIDKQLESTGTDAANATFRFFAGRLPAGVTLDESGHLFGVVDPTTAPGAYNFVVEIHDTRGGYGLQALAVVVESNEWVAPPVKPVDDGGCSTAGGDASGLLPFAAALLGLFGLGLRRRVALSPVRTAGAKAARRLAPFAALAAVFGVAGGAKAQTVTGPLDMQYTELQGATAAPAGLSDRDWASSSSDMWTVGLPSDFTFRFYGELFSFLNVSGNGAIVPLTTGSPGTSATFVAGTSNTDLPNTGNPAGIIAPWWDDWARSSSYSPLPGGLSFVVEGVAPHRVAKVQWKNLTPYACGSSSSLQHGCNEVKSYSFQAWIFEADAAGTTDSTIVFAYATPAGASTLFPETYTGSVASSAASGSVGLENVAQTQGLKAFSCTPDCKPSTHWPSNKIVVFGNKADLSVGLVAGSTVGYAGVTMPVSVKVSNVGPTAASNVTVRFYGSTDAALSADDVDLGLAAQTLAIAPGSTAVFSADVTLPLGLQAGNYHVIAVADPAGTVDEDILVNNRSVLGPIAIGTPTPDPVVASITTPAQAWVDGRLDLSWQVRNAGNASAVNVPYLVVLTTNEFVSSNDLVVASGSFTVGGLATSNVTLPVFLPVDLMPGTYYLGIVIDPDDVLHEITELNNTGITSSAFDVLGGTLRISSTQLPEAQAGMTYCPELKAVGGNGSYEWSVLEGSLPVGLELVQQSNRSTLLCGTAAGIGDYTFTLQVASADQIASRQMHLVVSRSGAPLTVATSQLPVAIFGAPYEASLSVAGGTAPYAWSIEKGTLPLGMTFLSTGSFAGSPRVDGSFPITAKVVDAMGVEARQSLTLVVSAPSRLTCVSDMLPAMDVGATVSGQLYAAGGAKPYTWKNLSTRRLTTGSTDPGATFDGVPPPGIHITQDGQLSGAPTQAGSYLWDVEVSDGSRATDKCTIRVDVGAGQGLTVVTSQLADAVVGVPYRAQLVAAGSDGNVTWSVMDGSDLPPGLALGADGALSGVFTESALEGETSRVFSFMVEVRDGQNRIGVAPLSVRLIATPATAPKPETTEDSGGCQASAGGPGVLALGLALGLAAFRRRR